MYHILFQLGSTIFARIKKNFYSLHSIMFKKIPCKFFNTNETNDTKTTKKNTNNDNNKNKWGKKVF